MRKIKGVIIIVVLVLISIFIFKDPIKTYVTNLNTNYHKYVYLGGDDITIYIDSKISTTNNTVTIDNKSAASGILTYIDYDNNTYGAIAHNVIDGENYINGNIYSTTILEINKSLKTIGNKVTVANMNESFGTVELASNTGIYGTYNASYNNKKPIVLAMPSEIKLGTAYIVTSINNEIRNYQIKITNINMFRKDKNITFTITDQNLINETGGIIKGMSGSPIIQNGKLIGALSHSYNNNFKKGNAIFITNMYK